MNWTYHANHGGDFGLTGDTLSEAICNGFTAIARDMGLGNAAGYRLVAVRAEYRHGILGGKGGIVLRVRHAGMPLASGCTEHGTLTQHCICRPTERVSEGWIFGKPEDCPEPIEIAIRPN